MKQISSLSILIIILTSSFTLIYGFKFVTKPEKKSYLLGQELFFNCSVDVFSDSGIDWVFTSFSNPESEHHIVQWREGNSYVVQPGYKIEQPDNLTSNLVISNPNSTFAGNYCCQYKNGLQKKSCASAKEIISELPQNEVVLAGGDVLLNCAQVRAFRWYRYLQNDLSDDKVIYMGSRMADDVDERFRVYTKPDNYPYERLDLYISDVQESLFGTYKCQQPRNAHCAEIIVLDSEPVCDIRFVMMLGVFVKKAELTCNVNSTSNVDPQMLCNDTTGNLEQASCSMRYDGIVTCTAEVSVEMVLNVECTLKFNPKPLQRYTTCLHASNQPSYSYKWMTSDDFLQINSRAIWLFAFLIALMIINIISVAICFFIRCRRLKDNESCDTHSTESESLSCNSEEKQESYLQDVI